MFPPGSLSYAVRPHLKLPCYSLPRATEHPGTTSVRAHPPAGAPGPVQANATAIGESATANALGASAFGQGANASAAGSVALGRGSLADQDNTVSVGSDDATTGFTRRIVKLAAGAEDSDAVNLGQLNGLRDLWGTNLAAALGGAAAWNGRVFTAPAFVLQGGRSEEHTSELQSLM